MPQSNTAGNRQARVAGLPAGLVHPVPEEIVMAKGLLFASFDTSPAREDEFNDWYDLEHVPERQRVPGFLNAQRWIGDDNPKIAVATYDLESHAVMNSPEYQAIGGANGSVWTKRITAIAKRLLRFEGTQIM